MFVWGSQNAIIIKIRVSSVLVRIATARLIIPFRVVPELIDWKSIVLVNTKRIRASSINGDIEEKSNYINKVSVSSSGLKAEMVGRCEVKF